MLWWHSKGGAKRRKEIARNCFQDSVLVVDYHDENLVIRRFDGATG